MADVQSSPADLTHALRVRSIEDGDPAVLQRDVESRYEPTVLRQLAGAWPAVQAARESATALRDYLSRQDNGTTVKAFVGQPGMGGRYFYRPDMDGFNFSVGETRVSDLLQTLLYPGETGQSIYMGSTPTRTILPRFGAENPMPIATDRGGEPRMWIGNSSRVAPHYDESDNIACVVSGRRRFILFPPEQVANLYVGPLDRTVAGQPISMVDLEPGDAIYIPALWWHAVQATSDLNVLVNYWWNAGPADAGSPIHALGHG